MPKTRAVRLQKNQQDNTQKVKRTCEKAALFADKEVPIQAKIAVMQVPTFVPRIKGMADSRVSKFCKVRATTIPVTALLL